MAGTDNQSFANNEVSLKDIILMISNFISYLKAKFMIIIAGGMLGAFIGLGLSLIKKPIYKAKLTFVVEDDKASSGGIGAALGLASQFGLDLGSASGGGAFSGDNLLELMKSRSMVESTLLTPIVINDRQQTLAEFYISINRIREGWDKHPNLKSIVFLPGSDRSKFTLQQDSVLKSFYERIIKNNLTVDKIDKKLSIIAVSVNSNNEIFAKNFCEVLVKTVSEFYIYTKTKKSIKNVNILQQQTDSVRRELNRAITGVASSVDVNPNPNPALQILRVPSQRRQVDVQANQAILTQLVANLEMSKMSLRRETPLVQIIDNPRLPLEKERLGKLKGMIIGGLISGFLTMILLSAKKVFQQIML